MMEGNAMKMMISETAIDDIARVCHEVNRAYCEGLGDYTQAPWEDAPEWQRASARMGVDLHLMGEFGPEASHISWMKQKLEEGWTYGPVKDVEKKEHPCLVPFDELPLEQQLKDHIFRAIVHALRPAKASGLTFGQALDALKAGKKVCRSGWNGSGMFAYYVPANSYPAQTGIAKEYFGDGALVPYRSYLALKTAQGDVATWAPSCSDALAEDWEIVQ